MNRKQSTKKGGTKGKAEGSRSVAARNGWKPELIDKARAITEDAGTYDERTRERIRRALEAEDERLPDMVSTAEILAAGEPDDKTSDRWRYWKLRSIEADLESGDAEKQDAARSYVQRLAVETVSRGGAHVAAAVLPYFIQECQKRNPAALAEGEDRPARQAARDILTRQKRDSDERAKYEQTGLYKPITFDDAQALALRIVPSDGDEEAHALISLLYGIVAAHYGERHEDYKGPLVEGLALEAAHRAYTRTMHFSDNANEFSLLSAETFVEIDNLRPEYYGEDQEGGQR